MVWAKLRGYTLPILRGSWRRSDAALGEDVDTISGTIVGTRFAEREVFSGETKMLTREKRDAFVGLIKGLGEVWLWSPTMVAYSSKGTGGTTNLTASITTTGGKFTGTGFLTPGSGVSLVLATTLLRRWWIEVWRNETAAVDGLAGGISVGANGWHHYVLHGSGTLAAGANPAGLTQYRDGAPGNFNAGHWFGLNSSGQVTLRGVSSAGSNAAKQYGQTIAQPFHGLSTWPAIAAARTVAEAALERLLLEGDDVGDARTVIGRVVDQRTEDGHADGVEMHGRRVSFDLRDAVNAAL